MTSENRFFFILSGFILTLMALSFLMGRQDAPANGAAGTFSTVTHRDVSPHAMNMQSFGDHHVEAQLSEQGEVQFFFYERKAQQLMPVEVQKIAPTMQAEAILPGEDAQPIPLQARPLPGEPEGRSSRFTGSFKRRSDQKLVGLALTFRLADNSYRVRWTPESLAAGMFDSSQHEAVAMPAAASESEARTLFLKPGGLYTADDIRANGFTTAAEKYRGQMAKHNMQPAPGSPICPITNTAADTRFVWVIAGKSYRFCCPPCIEEFVKQAKEKPETILPPDSYVKR